MNPIEVNIDWAGIGQAVVNALVEAVKTLMSPLPVQFETWLLQTLQWLLTAQGAHNVLTHIPTEWTVDFGVVRTLQQQGLVAMVALATIVGLIQAYRVMHETLDVYEAIGRTAFWMILAGTSLLWLKLIIVAVNALADSVLNTPIDIRNQSLPSEHGQAILLIIATLFAGLAWIKGAVGTLFVGLLIVIAPYVFIVSVLPMFEGLGKWWAEEMTTWCLRAFFVAVILRISLGLMGDAGALQYLFALVGFWLAWTIDSKIRRFSVGAWGSVGNLNLIGRGISAVAPKPALAAAAAAT